MLITELITQLEALKEKHGDLPIYYTANSVYMADGYEISSATYEERLWHPDYDGNDLSKACNPGIYLE